MIPDGWRKASLAQIASEPISYGVVQTGAPTEGGVACVRVVDLASGQLSPEGMITTSPEISESYRRTVLRPGDVMIALRGIIGRAVQVPSALEGCNLTRGIARVAPDPSSVRSDYLVQFLNGPDFQGLINRQANGSALQEVSIATLRAAPILLPPEPEQRQIAEVLSTWDRAIQTIETLIANAGMQKTALMQSLLTGRIRLPGFCGDWTSTVIGAVCDQVIERAGTAVNLPVLSCSKHDGFVESLKYFKKKVFSDDLSAYKVVRRGMIAFPTNHIEEGSIARQDTVDAGLVSPIYCVFQPRTVDGQFLIRLLKTDAFAQRFAAATNASVDRRGSLRWKEFSKLRLDLPSPDEQRAITAVIDDAERHERMLMHQRDALREEKAALMQQLLTGKCRLKTVESEAA